MSNLPRRTADPMAEQDGDGNARREIFTADQRARATRIVANVRSSVTDPPDEALAGAVLASLARDFAALRHRNWQLRTERDRLRVGLSADAGVELAEHAVSATEGPNLAEAEDGRAARGDDHCTFLGPCGRCSRCAARVAGSAWCDECAQLHQVETAARAYVRHEKGGGTRDGRWFERNQELFDALAAAIEKADRG